MLKHNKCLFIYLFIYYIHFSISHQKMLLYYKVTQKRYQH